MIICRDSAYLNPWETGKGSVTNISLKLLMITGLLARDQPRFTDDKTSLTLSPTVTANFKLVI